MAYLYPLPCGCPLGVLEYVTSYEANFLYMREILILLLTKTPLMEILMEAEQLIRPLPMVVGLVTLVYHSCSAAATLNIITAHLIIPQQTCDNPRCVLRHRTFYRTFPIRVSFLTLMFTIMCIFTLSTYRTM